MHILHLDEFDPFLGLSNQRKYRNTGEVTLRNKWNAHYSSNHINLKLKKFTGCLKLHIFAGILWVINAYVLYINL